MNQLTHDFEEWLRLNCRPGEFLEVFTLSDGTVGVSINEAVTNYLRPEQYPAIEGRRTHWFGKRVEFEKV